MATRKPTARAAAPAKAPKAEKPAAPAAKAGPAPKKPAEKEASTPKKPAPRADFGAPVDAFFAKQPPHLRPILDALRALVEEVAPDAVGSLKWGMPFYTAGGGMLCALGAHKAHVNLILSGPPGTFDDPKGVLVGDGKTGKHLKLTSLDQLPKADAKKWLKQAAALARKNG
jgi:hypothetical protein